MRIPLVGQHGENRSVNVNTQKLVNLFTQIESDGAKTELSLHSTPGLDLIGAAGSGPCRSKGLRWSGNTYFVSGGSLIKIDDSGTVTNVGSIATSSGNVSMAPGPSHFMLVDGTDGWTYDGTTLTKITDGDFTPLSPTHCAYIDGYFVVNDNGTGSFYLSALNDATSWDPADTATAESNPDDLTALIATHRELWLFGSQASEIWFNSGNADFPFEIYRGGAIEWGIQAPHSLAKADRTLFWLSQNQEGANMILAARGANPVVISTRDIETQISKITTTSDAVGWTYQQEGHTFYVLSFPSGDKTFVYDVSSSMWHTRKSYGIGRWRAFGASNIGNIHYTGDYSTGQFYRMKLDTYSENGAVLERTRVTQMLHKDRNRLRIDRLELDIETGVGTVVGQGVNPQIAMDYSRDGGHTWSSSKFRSLGAIGEYGTRVIWLALGIGRDWVFRFTVTDPVKVTMLGGYADITVCRP